MPLNLDDAKGYFKDLVIPNYDEFEQIYYANLEGARATESLIFRRAVNLSLILNHQLDKVWPATSFQTPTLLVDHIKSKYQAEGDAIDVIRRFANDVKHRQKLTLTPHRRVAGVADTFQSTARLPDWIVHSGGTTPPPNLREAAILAFAFWGKYFAGERQI